MSPSIAMNNFARRQTAESHFAHFDGSESVLLELVSENFEGAEIKDDGGTAIVTVPPKGFWSSVKRAAEVASITMIESRFGARREGEEPFLSHVFIGADKSPAKHVEIVLYAKARLHNSGDNSTDCDWEIVSINASPVPSPTPMDPVTMARNFLRQAGGTETKYSAADFAHAIDFWSRHVLCNPGE